MKHRIAILVVAAACSANLLLRGAEPEPIAGKWSGKKVNDDGVNCTQTLEVKKDKFVFEMMGPNGQLLAHAEGDIRLEKLGPFNVARFSHLRAGESASNLDDVDDEFVSVYTRDGDTLTLASNFDKQREQKPAVDLYNLVKATADSGTSDLLPTPPTGKTWKLIWHDEFDGPTLDESKWNRLGDSKRRDGYWVKEDAYLSDHGTLLLRTKKDGERYTCGAVNTQGKFEHAFGYYVARCRIPRQAGHWPAFWMMCPGVGTIGNEGRDGTEIDIVEIPWRDGKITMNLHWDGYGKEHKTAGTSMTLPSLLDGFHDYGLLWSQEQYIFYVDGKEVWHSSAGGVSQVPEYLKLTEEIGKWGGEIAKAELPDYFEVEYVRVYDVSE